MRNRVRLRITPATVIASIALLVALGGTSFAAVKATAPANSVNTAALKNNAVTNPKIGGSAVTGDKVKNGSLKKADFASGQIPAGPPGPEGPAGPAGPQGPTGPAGASATALWAVVDATGTLIRSKGVASALRLGTGDYQVVFNQDVTGCSYQAGVGGVAAIPFIGQANPSQRVNVPAGVEVRTVNVGGTAFADLPFHLAVFC